MKRDMLPLPRGVKPHIVPRYNCPPGNIYYGWNMHYGWNMLGSKPSRSGRARFEIVAPLSASGHIWGAFRLARELWNPGP